MEIKRVSTNIIEIQGYKFKLEPTFLDERKIKFQMAEICGGLDKLAEIEATIQKKYEDHLVFNEKRLGKEIFVEKNKRFHELNRKDMLSKVVDEEKTELAELRKLLTNNIHYDSYVNLLSEKILTYNYAFLQVMVVEPQNVNFMNYKEETLADILEQFLAEKKKLVKPESTSTEQQELKNINDTLS